ncbi:two-component regulator propeller domain-containing protein [Paradesertivirga mongoliensis]|uniref:histidine kinase n=1 Tax=Paradesertivirga mongoliensis TaxID=2100740 RepID=A0ABW4ZLB3_9SPHI|nr:hybrid sensor histidine kinase/response regulator transcription factor [Pedobacter mongoliensis]
MYRSLVLLWCAISFLYGRVRAQEVQYQFSHLNINNGLSHNQVTAIFKDSKGFMWFGTMTGLNRYDGFNFKVFKHKLRDTTALRDDFIQNIQEGPGGLLWIQTRVGFTVYNPHTERFDQNVERNLRSLSIPWPEIASVKKDRKGNYWFINASLGICRYDSKNKAVQHFYRGGNSKNPLYSNAVSDMAEDSQGNMWVIYRDGILEKIDGRSRKVSVRTDIISKQGRRLTATYRISIDRQGDIWTFATGSSIGAYYYSPAKKALKHFGSNSKNKLNSDIIYQILQDEKGLIWIATDHGGVNLINKRDFTVRYLVHREDDPKSLAQNSTTSMYKDNSGIIWIGTYKRGLSYYHENIIKFPLIRHHASDPTSLKYDDVNRFVEDAQGNLWIGTNGGGLIYFNRKTNRFTQYKHNPNNKNTLSNDVIVSLCIDHEQKLWIGTYFGGLDCFDGENFTHYRHDDNNPKSLSDDRVWEIFEDSQRNLWVGTLTGGVNKFDRATKTFRRIRTGPSVYTSSILEDRAGNIWFGTSQGIDVLLKQTNRFIHYNHSDDDPQSLIHDNVSNMLIDSRGLVWICTREGLSMLNPGTHKFTNFHKSDGLPDDIIIDILEDNNRNLWFSTANGLSNLILSKSEDGALIFKFKNYGEADGLQGLEFNESASLKTRRGEMIFGGANGFNIFDPQTIRSSRRQPILALTDFQIFNTSLKPGDEVDGHQILTRSITETGSVTLKHSENVFSIEFAALYFFNAEKVSLQYMLEGFDKDWLNANSKVRKATYTNLDPGSYTFKVRATNEEGIYSGRVLNFKIEVLPPFWKTSFAYVTYFLLFAFTLYSLRRRGIQKIKAKFELEQERQEAKRMHELDMMKIKFFTNVSHEFRTPLSLILAPVEKIIKQTEEPEQMRQLQMINRNARRLLNLVNQLLDFRKMEVQELKLHPKPGDLIKFIKEISYSFSDVAEKKNIGFVFDSECETLETRFDHDKIERILFNLLSNSFKFTPEGGHISVLLNQIESARGNHSHLEIKVIDTGIGIPPEKKDKIFERFFQNDVPGTMVNQGSGIGLSITKEFVKLHGGEITVESVIGEGSCFTVTLPIKTKSQDNAPVEMPVGEKQAVVENRSGKKQTVLLVEDNDDFRFYLKDNLREAFHIIEACNGKEGWQKALALHPNLIVSDISMPEMDGIALCRKIKSDARTLHIPVVLLTALTGEEQHLKGLETGATDYMTKPFNFEILLSKIRNILLQQESMRKTYQKQVEVKPSDIVVESPDETFIQKALLVVEKNISNADFSVEELSSEMYMSRVTLYKKVLALTGQTPVEFIRSVRIKRAAQLLEKGHLTISQIGYKVGFKSQKYFVRSFKAEYNMLPSAYIEQSRAQSVND